MRRIVSFAFIAALMALPPAALAEEQLTSCDDLTEVANALDEIKDALKEVGSIRAGSEDDKTLRGVVDDLHTIASVEKEPELDAALKKLEAAWEKMDWKAFATHLEKVTAIFDKMYRRDCR